MLSQSQHIPDDIYEFTLPHPPEVLLSQSITGVKEQTNQRIANQRTARIALSIVFMARSA